VVLLVKKTKDNAFQRGVTVGRTGNNDIVLDDPSVSRFHAWFQRDERGGTWTVADAGSKNGTTLSGTRLKGKRPVKVPDQTRLQFGEVPLTLFLPERFFAFLESRVRG
jgi:pSer/pThr/pTyr-binding forkhead associated (FHA) protein